MKNRSIYRLRAAQITLSVFAGATLVSCTAGPPPADTVITNAFVYTVDADQPDAEAVAVRDGEIVFVGSASGAKSFIDSETEVVDANGRMVMPGLIDAHVHPSGGGAGLNSCSLDYAQLTVEETLEVVQGCLDSGTGIIGEGDSRWLMVKYWDLQGLKPTGTVMTKSDLDQLDAVGTAVVLTATDGHNHVVNSKALELAGVDKNTPDPETGRIERDADGEPTGYFSDAGKVVTMHAPEKSTEEQTSDLKAGLRALNEVGVTAIYGNAGGLEQYNILQDEGSLTTRVSAAPTVTAEQLRASDLSELIEYLDEQKDLYDDGNVHVNTVGEILVDGVMEFPAFTAANLDPYLEDVNGAWQPTTNTGPTYFEGESLNDLVIALDAAGWNSHFHTVGDRAVRQVIDAVEAAREVNGETGTSFSTSHNQLVDPSDIPRFVDLGVTASFSPQWAQRDAYTVDNLANYIGPERANRLYPFGQLYEAGVNVSTGSDWPVDELSPWRMVEQAVTRTGAVGFDGHPGVLAEDQTVTLEQSIEMITKNAAKQIGMWDEIGSISVGKRADMLILDQNLFEIPAGEIHATNPTHVYFDGVDVL
ncbi:amidohydrolase [Agromyces subbeticus]|uniref:amidohydrolase n=1 Tax=Agromyces subbeticus TaxID=293890 RepID=UPI0003B77306|nr:amidohydrolase [Agromyces subbeticus]